ncbi:MAG: HAD-IC family P-type ATPase [Chloroflexota bacterium]|jgi:cation-transporting ATPase E
MYDEPVDDAVNMEQTHSPILGLSETEVIARRSRGQGNDVALHTSRSYGQILRDNLLTFFNIVLFGVSLILLLLGSPRDAFFTAGVAVLNILIATIQEVRAKRKLDQISLLARPKATVIRDGQEQEVDPSEIVLDDVLVVEPGDQIVVDGEVIGEGRMDVDESLLTGESDHIHKKAGDSVYSGSFCVVGRAAYIARQVGGDSLANRLTESARTFSREKTPLQREVDLIIRVLLLVVLFFGQMLALNFFVNEEATLLEAVRAASVVIGLAPSSLFLTIVVAYALGALRIANKGALVQQANSVESLCHVTVLCLDKTGTLTANQIKLDQVYPLSEPGNPVPVVQDAGHLNLALGTFAHSVSSSNRTSEALAESFPGRQAPFSEEVPFSSSWKWSAQSYDSGALRGTYILGAPEILGQNLLPQSELGSVSELDSTVDQWTNNGQRVLLFARHPEITPLYDAAGQPRLPAGLQPMALLGFSDELRPEARQTLDGFARAGIELKIISGDNPRTVAAVARQAGLGGEGSTIAMISGPELDQLDDAQFHQAALDKTIFGRITPDQKEKLVRVLRDSDHYVAMTGDGVNDVLALKQANLGVAMQSGSQASRSVSDIVLLNDSFAALPEAFIEGQRILNGMEDIFRLYMTRIFSLALLIAMIAMLAVGFPFTPSQSSIISLLTLSIPAFALALWARPGPVRQGSLTRRLVHFVLPAAITMSAAGLGVYLFFVVSTGDTAYGQLALTYTMMTMGLILIIFVEPPTQFWVGGDALSGDWRPTLLALGIFAFFIMVLTVEPIQEFYELPPLHAWTDYLVIGAVTLIWVIVVRFVWRRGIIDRYLNLGSLRGFS